MDEFVIWIVRKEKPLSDYIDPAPPSFLKLTMFCHLQKILQKAKKSAITLAKEEKDSMSKNALPAS